MSCYVCRCADNGFCHCSCHKPATPPALPRMPDVYLSGGCSPDTPKTTTTTTPAAPKRWEIRRNDDGTVDEVVTEHVHVEQMADGEWWIGIYTSVTERIALTLSARGKIKATVNETPAVVPEGGAEG
jgi:hypothetical protein